MVVGLQAIIFFYMEIGELEIFRVHTHTHTHTHTHLHNLSSTRGSESEVNTQFLLTIIRIV